MQYRYGDFAEKYLGVKYANNENMKVVCLFHEDHDPSMSFHMDKGAYLCFSCGAKGNIISLSRKLGLTIIGDDYIEELDDPEAEWAAFVRSLDETDPDTGSPRPWKETRLRPFLDAGDRYRKWSDRGISRVTVDAWQLGYDSVRDHLVIPCRAPFTNKLIGITRRQLRVGARPKYLDARGYPKSRTMFGSWAPLRSKFEAAPGLTWVLTEGPVDALKVWQAGYNGRAILGGVLTRDQIDLMLKYDVQNVVMFFDDDKQGFNKALKAAGRLHRKFTIYQAQYGYRTPNDPGAMSTQEIRNAITNAVCLNGIQLV